jgi:hypothetical protein
MRWSETAARRAFTFQMIKTVSRLVTLALGLQIDKIIPGTGHRYIALI